MVLTRNGALEEIRKVPLLRVSSELEDLTSPIDRRSQYYREHALEQQLQKKGKHAPVAQSLYNIPNALTFLRILLVPVFVIFWFLPHTYASITTAIIFILAAVTDWLDGYLARRMKITSAFGAFLDPVADKIMVSTALVLLASNPPAPITPIAMTTPVTLIIAREITMSALREWAAASGGNVHKAVKVSSLGKWKTALQMTAMSVLLVLRNVDVLLSGKLEMLLDWAEDGVYFSWVLLCAACGLGLWSLYKYMANVWHYFRYPELKH